MPGAAVDRAAIASVPATAPTATASVRCWLGRRGALRAS